MATFQGFVKQHIKHEFLNNRKAHDQHQDFLDGELKKHINETVHEFAQLLQCHNKSILPWLPGAPATGVSCSSLKIKKMVFEAMPLASGEKTTKTMMKSRMTTHNTSSPTWKNNTSNQKEN